MTMIKPMMKCGHKANGTYDNGKPCCIICAGIKKGYNEIMEEPDLSNRECICGGSCKKIVKSVNAVAFFKYRPNEQYDEHYDGCDGWN